MYLCVCIYICMYNFALNRIKVFHFNGVKSQKSKSKIAKICVMPLVHPGLRVNSRGGDAQGQKTVVGVQAQQMGDFDCSASN